MILSTQHFHGQLYTHILQHTLSQNTQTNKTKQNIHLHTQIDNDHYGTHLHHREDTQTENNTLRESECRAWNERREMPYIQKSDCTLLKKRCPCINYARLSILKLPIILFLRVLHRFPPSFFSCFYHILFCFPSLFSLYLYTHVLLFPSSSPCLLQLCPDLTAPLTRSSSLSSSEHTLLTSCHRGYKQH